MFGRWLPFILSILVAPITAIAMQQSQVPPKFPIPWANSAGPSYLRAIPEASQIGITNCAASLTDGFPPLTFIPQNAGGCPPFGQDTNGILKQVTQWSRWQGAGAFPTYDASFSSSIGGYPSGATLANTSTPGCFWISTVDNNTSNPDTGGANWNFFCPGGGIGGTSTGSANAQIVSANSFVLKTGAQASFVAGFANTGGLTVNVNGTGAINVFRTTQLGTSMSVGGEIAAGQLVRLAYDGTQWQCISCRTIRVGAMEKWPMLGTTAPGTLVMDGTCVSQTIYADLYAVIGATYGTCAAGQFALPDARGRVTVARDNQGSGINANRLSTVCASTTLGATCGGQTTTLAQSALPNVTLGYSGSATGSLSGSAVVHSNSIGFKGFSGAYVQGNEAPFLSNQGANTNSAVEWIQGDFGLTVTGSLSGGASAGSTNSLNGNVTQTAVPTVQPTLIVTEVIYF